MSESPALALPRVSMMEISAMQEGEAKEKSWIRALFEIEKPQRAVGEVTASSSAGSKEKKKGEATLMRRGCINAMDVVQE